MPHPVSPIGILKHISVKAFSTHHYINGRVPQEMNGIVQSVHGILRLEIYLPIMLKL